MPIFLLLKDNFGFNFWWKVTHKKLLSSQVCNFKSIVSTKLNMELPILLLWLVREALLKVKKELKGIDASLVREIEGE